MLAKRHEPSQKMTDISFVSLPGVVTCAVGGVIRIFAWSLNKDASQVASAKRFDKLSGIVIHMAHDSGHVATVLEPENHLHHAFGDLKHVCRPEG